MADLRGQQIKDAYDSLLTEGTGSTPIEDGQGTAKIMDAGTWTPVFEPASGSFGSITMSFFGTTPRWTKIGSLYILTATVGTVGGITVGTASGDLYIGGLDTAPVATTEAIAGTISSSGRIGAWTNSPISCDVNSSQGAVRLMKKDSVTGEESFLQVSDMDTASGNRNSVSITAFYFG